ncbi:MAG: hypothetical protein IPO18_20470 [bacterium]|nr:hypothetical protein [bacterium]
MAWLVDVRGWRRPMLPFEAFGFNPMLMFFGSGVLARLLVNARWGLDGGTPKTAAHAALPPCFRALGRSGMGVGPVRERPGPALDDGRLGAVPPGLGLAGVNAGRRPEPESIVLPVK